VVDNTNPTVTDRQRYIIPAKKYGYLIQGFFMQSIVKDCVERNKTRQGKAAIPATAIAAISNKLELPYYDEGFDYLYYVQLKDDCFDISKWRDIDEI